MKQIVLLCVGIIVLVSLLFIAAAPNVRRNVNNWNKEIQIADDETRYETIKEVHDTCRAMIASYKSDKMIYEQYKDDESFEVRSWAAQAKIRANRTAYQYNEYILKNDFIWKFNVPEDIAHELELIQ